MISKIGVPSILKNVILSVNALHPATLNKTFLHVCSLPSGMNFISIVMPICQLLPFFCLDCCLPLLAFLFW